MAKESTGSRKVTRTRIAFDIFALGIVAIGYWHYLELEPRTIDELDTVRGGRQIYCNHYVRTAGVVSPRRAPGYETGDGFRGYWLAGLEGPDGLQGLQGVQGKSRAGGDSPIEVRFNPNYWPAPRVGQALEIGGTARCDPADPGNNDTRVVSMVEATRRPR